MGLCNPRTVGRQVQTSSTSNFKMGWTLHFSTPPLVAAPTGRKPGGRQEAVGQHSVPGGLMLSSSELLRPMNATEA